MNALVINFKTKEILSHHKSLGEAQDAQLELNNDSCAIIKEGWLNGGSVEDYIDSHEWVG